MSSCAVPLSVSEKKKFGRDCTVFVCFGSNHRNNDDFQSVSFQLVENTIPNPRVARLFTKRKHATAGQILLNMKVTYERNPLSIWDFVEKTGFLPKTASNIVEKGFAFSTGLASLG